MKALLACGVHRWLASAGLPAAGFVEDQLACCVQPALPSARQVGSTGTVHASGWWAASCGQRAAASSQG